MTKLVAKSCEDARQSIRRARQKVSGKLCYILDLYAYVVEKKLAITTKLGE